MDYLFWRLKAEDLELDQVRCYPWILWMVWKARNDKIFNGLNRPPEEILNKVSCECKAWLEATQKSDHPESNAVILVDDRNSATTGEALVIKCRTGAAWKENEDTCGLGWCLFDTSNHHIHLGLKGTRKCLSAIHAELLDLIWTMQCLIDIKAMCYTFETDCKELLSITDLPQDWPIYEAELADYASLKGKLPHFNLSYVSRASNTHADFLACSARIRGCSFSYVNAIVPL
ncbi:hypothetical protein V5N11_011025 [Cardamine amara subsp. amara]|uniref:RNase H type-1 domain-containing protein n=1 Tax=Cardamine amara subsp. amara TaxID=228776 RepID=A0ABD1BVL7_CARAN